jgi:hypothetical protein
MRRLPWIAALAVFGLFFGVYSFRLGVRPVLMHDDFEYTYPSFSLAERGNFGSPLLGTGLNIQNRTYNLVVYYYASVHAVLIRMFGDEAQSIPLANTFHFALLAAVGAFFLAHRRAILGLFLFLYSLVSDSRMVESARHGRPEMTAGCCLTLALMLLWLWFGEGRRSTLVLAGASAALTAAMLSHTSTVFFTLALAAAYAVSLLRQARPRQLAIGLLPFLTIPLIYLYFVLTDDIANLKGQLSFASGQVMLGQMVLMALTGEWSQLARSAAKFLDTHSTAGLWLAIASCLVLPKMAAGRLANAARFFAAAYALLFFMNFLCLKPFVLSYRSIYQAIAYLALALLGEVLISCAGNWLGRPAWRVALRIATALVFAVLLLREMELFREDVQHQHPPFAQLERLLTYGLLESGARLGDRVFTPSPFGFELRRSFDVVAYPAPRYSNNRWSEGFRDGLRKIWGDETLERLDPTTLCNAMGFVFLRPTWVLAWDADYSSVLPLYDFLRRYPDIPGMEVARLRRVALPAAYGGTIRVYRLSFSEPVDHLDRSIHATVVPCP